MIDYAARKSLADKNRQSQSQRDVFSNMFGAMNEANKLKEENAQILDRIDAGNSRVENAFEKLGRAVAMIFKRMPSINLPKIFNVQGEVKVSNAPKTENIEAKLQLILNQISALKTKKFPTNFVVDNLFEMEEYFDKLDKSISSLKTAISSIPAAKIDMPKIEMPKYPKIEMPKADNSKMEELLNELNDQIAKIKYPKVEIPKTISVDNFPRQMVPQPVTNININALQGFAKSTNQTVGTSLVTLPSYGQLFNRRSLIIFNNDASATLYIGGSDVTISNGTPILPQTFSPSIDAGYNMVIYGVSTTNINVRVMEISKDQTQNVQE